ncbi:unnamed protein product, partial [marine sediment metagenome]
NKNIVDLLNCMNKWDMRLYDFCRKLNVGER